MISSIRKHWKKIALALCTIFWSGCSDEKVEDGVLYGPPPCIADDGECKEEFSYPSACAVDEYCASGVTLECNGTIVSDPPKSLDSCKAIEAPCLHTYACDDGVLCKEEYKNNAKIINCDGWVEIDGERKNHVTYTEEEFKAKYETQQKDDAN